MNMEKQDLLQKLKNLFPEFDKFGLNVSVEYSQDQNSWIATIEKDGHELKTHLDEKDVQECVEGVKCYNFGIQLGQFIRNYCQNGDECEL